MNYIRIYVQLIEHRRECPINHNKNNPGEVHYHHIIPKSCNGINTIAHEKYNVFGSNLVGLTLREHFIAHKLLQKIYLNSKFETYMNRTLQYFTMTLKNQNKLRITSHDYEKAAKLNCDIMKKCRWITNGITECYTLIDEVLPDGYRYGRLNKGKPKTGKNTRGKFRSVNDGKHWFKIPINDSLPIGCKEGRIKGQFTGKKATGKNTAGKFRTVNANGKKFKIPIEAPLPPGCSEGTGDHRSHKGTGKNEIGKYQHITNGVKTKRVLKTLDIPIGWKKGNHIKPMLGKVWINNGITEQYIDKDISIPDGYVFGRLKHNKKFITNGIITKAINKNQPIPDGWKLGTAKKGNIRTINNGKREKSIPKTELLPDGWFEGRLKGKNYFGKNN